MAFLTTITTPNYVPLSPEALQAIGAWCEARKNGSVYTGQLEYGYLPDGTTWQIKRWDWDTEETCNEYFDEMRKYNNQPGTVTEITPN